METISCPSHGRASALPPPAKVTSTKWLTETAWQPTAHPAVRLGPDSSLRRIFSAQNGRESSCFPAPLPLPRSALAVACAASLHSRGHIVSGGLDRLRKTANPVQLPIRLGHTAKSEENGPGPVTLSGPHLDPLELYHPALMTVLFKRPGWLKLTATLLPQPPK